MRNQWERSHMLRCQHRHKHVTINAKPMGMISQAAYLNTETSSNLSKPNQRHYLIGFNVNTDTSSNLSMPNQWALSHRLRGQQELTHTTINVKPMGTISQASMSTWTQALNYECQYNHQFVIVNSFCTQIHVFQQ